MITKLFKGILDYFTGKNLGPHRMTKRVHTQIIVFMFTRQDQLNPQKYAKAAMLNLSETGICAESQQIFVLGQNVYINIFLPSGQQYQISGDITRVEDYGSTYLYGINILPIYADRMKVLLHFFRLR